MICSEHEEPGSCPACAGEQRPLPEAPDSDADRLYKVVVNPDLTWWDDLTPEMQDGWRRGARLVSEARREGAEQVLDVERLARALYELEPNTHYWSGDPVPWEELVETRPVMFDDARKVRAALLSEPVPARPEPEGRVVTDRAEVRRLTAEGIVRIRETTKPGEPRSYLVYDVVPADEPVPPEPQR